MEIKLYICYKKKTEKTLLILLIEMLVFDLKNISKQNFKLRYESVILTRNFHT